MLSLQIVYDIPQDRNLHIQLPPTISLGKHEIVLIVDNAMQTPEISPSEQFADLIGSLAWDEDSLEYQRRIREEWS